MIRPKVICLMPVKNEVDLLPITLKIISQYCDAIIIADQMSDDGSREVYKKFTKVIVIDNLREGHSNQVRWDLLKAAREFGNNNLIICLDADEFVPPALFNKFLNDQEFNVGDSFSFPWIQLWKSVSLFNNTGVWYKNYQQIAWVDDGITDYANKVVINDHVSRVPPSFLNNCKRIDAVPIIHLQWASWEKTQFKQVWYRCTELIKSPQNYSSINSKYAHSLDLRSARLTKVPDEWIDNPGDLKAIEKLSPTWHLQEIYRFFDQYGILFFEPLQIWHIPVLEQEFEKLAGRKPVSIQQNLLLRTIKNVKRRVVKILHSFN